MIYLQFAMWSLALYLAFVVARSLHYAARVRSWEFRAVTAVELPLRRSGDRVRSVSTGELVPVPQGSRGPAGGTFDVITFILDGSPASVVWVGAQLGLGVVDRNRLLAPYIILDQLRTEWVGDRLMVFPVREVRQRRGGRVAEVSGRVVDPFPGLVSHDLV